TSPTVSGAGGRGWRGIFVTTLSRLAEQLAAPSLHPRRPATSAIVASAWRQALAEDAGRFDKVKDHPATVRALVSVHRHLRDLSAEARNLLRCSTPLTPDLLRLHERVVARLASEWYDVTDLLHAGAEVIDRRPERLAEQGAVVLYLPQALSMAETGFAQALTGRDMTVIVGATGVRRADAAVRRTMTRLGAPWPEVTVTPSSATRIMHASDSDDEVRCVTREVVQALSDGTPAHRIAVLYGAARPYARLLHELLAGTGLRVNGLGTRSVEERAVARGFLGVLELARRRLPRGETFAAMAEAPTSDLAGGSVKVGRWERVSRLAGIVGGAAEDWQPKLGRYVADQRTVIEEQEQSPDPWLGRLEAAKRELEAAEELGAFIGRLDARLVDGVAHTTWGGLSTWALVLFHDLYGGPDSLQRLPLEEQHAAAVVESTLGSLAALDAFEATVTLTGLVEVLSLELGSALPRVGRFGEGVFVGPVSAAVGLDLDAVFVVGLAEDGYPGRLHEEALLNDTARCAAGGELEQLRDRLDAKHRHLLAAFSSAPSVTATFPRGDLRRSTERLPSRFLLPTLRDITGDPRLAATAWDTATDTAIPSRLVGSRSFARELQTTRNPATEQEWRVRAASAQVALDDTVVDAAHTVLDARASSDFTRFDGNLGEVGALPDYAHDDRVISPTSLESYATCPHQYFVKKLLRVEPLQQPEEVIKISAMEIGNLIHTAMDVLIAECTAAGTLPSYGVPWSAEQRLRLSEIATETGVRFTEKGLTGHPRLWEAELQHLLVDLDRLLDDDDAWRAERDAAVVHSELAFGLHGIAPVVIELDDGAVHMLGSADKVDRTRAGVLLVTDIKSGKARTFAALKDDPVAAGTKLQLPVYAYAARQRLGGEAVEAQYWFVRAPDAFKRIPVVLDDVLEKIYADTVGTLVTAIHDGLFIPRPSAQPPYAYVECPYCTPDGIGHEEARRRYERKRTAPVLSALMGLTDPDALADTGSEE
ncbi:MAG: PD-(D/E)XK nuclease family protein, partial [Nocardioidaceae bacterium]